MFVLPNITCLWYIYSRGWSVCEISEAISGTVSQMRFGGVSGPLRLPTTHETRKCKPHKFSQKQCLVLKRVRLRPETRCCSIVLIVLYGVVWDVAWGSCEVNRRLAAPRLSNGCWDTASQKTRARNRVRNRIETRSRTLISGSQRQRGILKTSYR